MALVISNQYANSTAPSTAYPQGSWKNETSPGALDGTPHELAWPNDIYGFLQAALAAAGVTPNGSSDTALVSQYLQAVINHRWYSQLDYAVGTKVVGSDGVTYVCNTANGPATSVQDPVTESAPRSVWFTDAQARFDEDNPVGTIRMTGTSVSPGTQFGVGTWTRIRGRFIVGVSDGDADFDLNDKGGAKQHNHGSGSYQADNHSHGSGSYQADDHSHLISGQNWNTSATGNANLGSITFVDTQGQSARVASAQKDSGTASASVSGTSGTASSLPPYIAKYIWERTA